MPNSNLLTLRDLISGAGRTGLSVKLRRIDDNFAHDYATATELPGKPGIYEFIDIPMNKYKLWVNGTEDTSFGGTNGRWWPTDDLLAYISEKLNLDGFLRKSGGTMSGGINMNSNPINGAPIQDENTPTNHFASVGLIMGVNSFIGQNYVNKNGDKMKGPLDADGYRFINAPSQDENTPESDFASVGLIMGVNSYIGQNYVNIPQNIIIVDPSFSVILGRKYNNIQDAINYAQSKSPSYINQYHIYIMPHKSNSGYVENISLQPYVHLIGLIYPKISGTVTGGNANTFISGLKFRYTGNFSLNTIRAYNSFFNVDNNDTGYELSMQNCILNSCGIINTGIEEFNPKITSGGNNIFINCVSNIACSLQSSDKGSLSSLESLSTDFS